MKITKLSLPLFLLLAAGINAQEKPAANEPVTASSTQPAKIEMDKISYAIGTNIGRQLSQLQKEGYTLDVPQLTEAISTILEGKPSKLSPEQIQAAMSALETELQSKQAAKAASASSANKAEGTKFLAENAKKEGVITTASGLQYEILKKAEGEKPKATDTVKVHYHGTLLNGKVFDSSVERNEPIEFPLQQVIKGWTEVVQLMPVGSKFKTYIPAELAYGDQGAGEDIGPGSTLIFEIELLAIVKK
jgi:FKBP-type peptidyl-prolyl cis-trans isomerase